MGCSIIIRDLGGCAGIRSGLLLTGRCIVYGGNIGLIVILFGNI